MTEHCAQAPGLEQGQIINNIHRLHEQMGQQCLKMKSEGL